MDGVVADFDKGIKELCPELETSDILPDYDKRAKIVDKIVSENLEFFDNLPLIEGAHEYVTKLAELYDIYFLSTPMWNVPHSFTGKRIWLERNFGQLAYKRLILTHRKDLNIGDYLVDDRFKNGASDFKGKHIHFGGYDFPNWYCVYEYLKNKS